jgi:hypothetical protein
VRLYLDTNVLAGVEERAEEPALAAWLHDRGHGAVVTDVHLAEALAIRDEATRNVRLDHLVALRSKGPYPKPVGFLKAEEYVAEVRRRRAGWIEPFPRTDEAQRFLRAARGRWTEARRDRAALIQRQERYSAVIEPAIRVTRDVQKEGRALQREGHDAINGLVLGNRLVALSGPVPTADRVATFPLVAIATWYGALYEHQESVRDLADYAQPYLRRGIPLSAFITLWLSDLQARELPRALSGHVVAEEQLNSKIAHGNTQDVNHATYAIDADLFVTADLAFFDALRAVPAVVPQAAPPVFLNRAAPSMVEQLDELA